MSALKTRRIVRTLLSFLAIGIVGFLVAIQTDLGSAWTIAALARIEDARRLESAYRVLPDSPVGYTIQPNLTGHYVNLFGAAVTTNAEGFRSLPFAPKGDAFRVVVLGDCIAFGYFQPDAETLSARLTERLAEGGVKAEVLNLATPGYSLPQMIASYEEYGRALAPDVVLIQTEPGDIGDAEDPLLSGPFGRGSVFHLAIDRGARARRYRLAPEQVAGRFAALDRELRNGGVPLGVLYFPNLADQSRNAVWRQDRRIYADANPALLLDVLAVLEATGRPVTMFRKDADDEVHPDSEAIRLVADAVGPWLIDQARAKGRGNFAPTR
jgi:lysophospholipase L1-like esterase